MHTRSKTTKSRNVSMLSKLGIFIKNLSASPAKKTSMKKRPSTASHKKTNYGTKKPTRMTSSAPKKTNYGTKKPTRKTSSAPKKTNYGTKKPARKTSSAPTKTTTRRSTRKSSANSFFLF